MGPLAALDALTAVEAMEEEPNNTLSSSATLKIDEDEIDIGSDEPEANAQNTDQTPTETNEPASPEQKIKTWRQCTDPSHLSMLLRKLHLYTRSLLQDSLHDR